MAVSTDIPPEMARIIDERLATVEADNRVRLLFAVESGSRAWGFPSPDSDYDVRFIYVHEPEWYLSIDSRRDVIELPIEGDLDINGWDLKKALQLLIKPNPVLLEWLRSPIVYRVDEVAKAKLLALGDRAAHRRPASHHYIHLADSQYRRFINGKDTVPIKKYFYALRPALALKWLREQGEAPLPMALGELRARLELGEEVDRFMDDLLARKKVTKELGEGPRLPALDRLIETEIGAAKAQVADLEPLSRDLLDDANALFRDLVRVQTLESEPVDPRL